MFIVCRKISNYFFQLEKLELNLTKKTSFKKDIGGLTN